MPVKPHRPPRMQTSGIATQFLKVLTILLTFSALYCSARTARAEDDLRIGMIGLDTSHVIAFAELLNNPQSKDHVPGGKIVAAFPGGSPDLEASRTRIAGYTQQLQDKHGVRLCDSIEELCRQVDAVLLMSVDGRKHLEQARPVIAAGKPLFLDKPMAASLRDVSEIFRLAKAKNVPVFSASALRFGSKTQAVRQGSIGRVTSAETFSPCHVEPSHPELFWYGVHGVESLYTVMGVGCETVAYSTTADGRKIVTGRWSGGRTGIYREQEGYGGSARGEKGESEVGAFDGYRPLVVEILKFFGTGASPVPPEETAELFAFMTAAEESKRLGGKPVSVREVLARVAPAEGTTSPPKAAKLEVRKIWDAAEHNAFTDLALFGDQFFCVFREGSGHVSPDGSIRVLASKDGDNWSSVALVQRAGEDLRDPKLSVTPDGRLQLIAAAARRDSEPTRHQTWTWFSSDGRTWSEPAAIGEPDNWLWRITWHDGQAWGIGYDTRGESFVRLFRSVEGRKFETIVDRLQQDQQPNESSILFLPDEKALCLLRRDGTPGNGLLGIAKPPYAAWEWKDLGMKLGGPHWLRLPDGRFVAAVRLYDGRVRTALAWVDIEQGRMTEFLELPSGGDSSYAGLVWHDGRLWVSYYSSHEGKTSIYLAKVELPPTAASSTGQIQHLFQPPTEFNVDKGGYRSPLIFDDGSLVTRADQWPARREEIRQAWTEALGAWPPLVEHPRLETLSSESREGITQQRVRVQVSPWEKLEGWLLIPAGERHFPAVLVCYYEPETSIGLKGELRDFAYQLTKRGFVTLSIGSPGGGDARKPELGSAKCQPLAYLAYVAANCHRALSEHPSVDASRIGIVGHSYGGKWALFAACLYDKFACGAWSDPGIVWDESRPNVNYWEPWYLGYEPGQTRRPGLVTADNPRTGAYRELVAQGHDLHELQALMAPRPFFVSGGSEDPPAQWNALYHCVQINSLLGYSDRVGMSSRSGHDPTAESNAQLYAFFDHALRN